jgi:hypothetical protein
MGVSLADDPGEITGKLAHDSSGITGKEAREARVFVWHRDDIGEDGANMSLERHFVTPVTPVVERTRIGSYGASSNGAPNRRCEHLTAISRVPYCVPSHARLYTKFRVAGALPRAWLFAAMRAPWAKCSLERLSVCTTLRVSAGT